MNSPHMPLQPSAPPKPKPIASAEQTLQPSDIALLDYQLLGPKIIGEAVRPREETIDGIEIPKSARSERYQLRVLRLGQCLPQTVADIQPGALVYLGQMAGDSIRHTFPPPEGGVDRVIFTADANSILGVFPSDGWTERWQTEKYPAPTKETAMDFTDDIRQCIDAMMSPEDAAKIEIEPLGNNVVVEHMPPRTREKSFARPDLQKLPIFRIVKMGKPVNLPEYMNVLRLGSLIYCSAVQTQKIETTLMRQEEHVGGKVIEVPRELAIIPITSAVGHFPAFAWPRILQADVKDGSEVIEKVQGA